MNPTAFRAALDETLKNLSLKEPLACRRIMDSVVIPEWPTIQSHLSVGRSVCGKTWSANQIAYKCMTCEKDPTCIICVDCFKNSDHIGHDYKMIKTGGGMCDCGDPTAWDPKGFCKDHQGISEDSDVVSKIPTHVRDVLTELVGFSMVAVVKCIQAITTIPDVSPLQESIKFLMNGLVLVTDAGDTGRRLVAMVICEGKDATLKAIFELETGEVTPPWEGAMSLLHDLIALLIPDPWFKFRFANALMEHYFALHLKKERNAVGVKRRDERFFTHFSVQVLTVPTICTRLHATILRTLTVTLLSALAHTSATCPPDNVLCRMTTDADYKMEELQRVFHDLGYVVGWTRTFAEISC